MNKNKPILPEIPMSTIVVTALALLVLVCIGAFFTSGPQNKEKECIEWAYYNNWICIMSGEIINKSEINSTTSTPGNCTLIDSGRTCLEYKKEVNNE